MAVKPGWLGGWAVNITHWQLLAGQDSLRAAAAAAVAADAARLPFADGSVDGIISVEAAFQRSPRAATASSPRRCG